MDMNISIIAVGSELLLGQIANTNGQYLSRLFNSIGKSVVEHTVIGDNPQRLEYVIKEGLNVLIHSCLLGIRTYKR